MRSRRNLTNVVAFVFLFGLIGGGYFAREAWLPWVTSAKPIDVDDDHDEHSHSAAGESQQAKLSVQAQANLKLVVKPLTVETYWRTIQVPGMIVDRPARSDRSIVAPVTGVVAKVHDFPGDTVKPGEPLFTLRLLSETMQLTQSELFKTSKEIEITNDHKNRLSGAASSGAVSEAKLIEIDNQLRRLAVAAQAYRTELQARGLTSEQIEDIAQGKYVSEIVVNAPKQKNGDGHLVSGLPTKSAADQLHDAEPTFEVQELKVELGQQVQAGQTLCLLSNHQSLYIEGRAFRQETPLLEKAAKEGWPIQVDFMEDGASAWPAFEQTFTVQHIANTIDATSRTFAFYIALVNQSRSFQKDDRTLMLWRFRPGQRVRLQLRVEKLDNVFVLLADAVVRDGPEAYVFRQNGDLFDRKSVHVVYQDREHVVIANDGSIAPGLYVAQNAATQINRVLKSGSGGLLPGFHMHADGSIHSNSEHK